MSLFGGGAAATAATAAAQAQGDTSGDIALSSPPEDSISDISFSPTAELLAVSSWDKKVRIYEISENGTSAGKAMYEHEAPVLSVVWNKVTPGSTGFVTNRTMLMTASPGWFQTGLRRRRQDGKVV